MIKRLLPLLIGLSIGGTVIAQDMPAATPATGSQMQTTANHKSALDEAAIKTSIANAGYKEVKGLEFDDGVWQAKARGGNDKWVKLSVGPVTGNVYPEDAPSKLNKDEINAKLTAAGYKNVHDVEFDDGLWKADANNAQGNDVDLLVDPTDGSVVAESND